MLSLNEFQEEYPPEKLEERLPDRPISSLRDIQYLYGRLYTLATAGGGEYADYLTPDEARELIDEPESLIVVRVDLSGDEPRLDSERPVQVTRYEPSHVEKVAHCKYDAARGIDHSITHRSGKDSGPGKLARYATERLSKWPSDEIVAQTAQDHSEGWIVEGLATLGENEAALETVRESVEAQLSGSTTALLTVRVKLEKDSDYLWPGEVAVFNEAMRARKLSKLVSKNEATNSVGTAVDLVTGESTRTVGTAEDPLNYYLGKQMEKFPGFDPDEAWRTHPVSEDAAITIMKADTFVDACTYTAFNAAVYYLPYFVGYPSPEETYILYDILHDLVDGSDMTPVEESYQTLGADGLEEYSMELRFYVGAIMRHQMSRFDVYGETLHGSLLYPVEIAATHDHVLDSSAFNANHPNTGELTAAMPTHDQWSLLSGGDKLPMVAGGGYFYPTFPEGDDDTDPSVDDYRIQALIGALSGDQLSVAALLEAYVERLLDTDGDAFPSLVVASQFAQLSTLAATGLLDAATEHAASIAKRPTFIETMDSDPTTHAIADGGVFAARHEKLEQFIDGTPALDENAERRGAFLLGALIGAVGSYQSWHEGRSTTLVDQFPVKSITQNRIKKATQEAIDKTVTYSRQENQSSTKFEWIVDRLRETVLSPDPDDWQLSTDDLRFYYALGVTYGMNDRPESSNPEE